MTEKTNKLTPKWQRKHISSSNSHVPARPGLYVIGHNHTYNGLEIGRVYVYVGKTENLRRRLGEHAPDNEENPELRKYLQQWIGHAMCWYAIMDKSELNKGERELIRKLQPCCNRQGK